MSKLTINEIYGELELINIVVQFDAGKNGWYFYDHTILNDEGNGVFYPSSDEAAHAAYALYFGDPELLYADEPEYMDETDFMTDAEADADVLRNAGFGTDEDYGLFRDESYDHFERDHDESYIPDNE